MEYWGREWKVLWVLFVALLLVQCGSVGNGDGDGAPSEPIDRTVASTTVSAGASVVVADGRSSVTIRATVQNSTGQGIPGITVTFTTTAGTLSVPSGNSKSTEEVKAVPSQDEAKTATAVTNNNGVATVNLIAATQVGTATVTASAQGFLGTFVVTFVADAPTTVSLTATPTTVNAGDTSTIQATVTDANNNPVPEVTVTFSFVTNASGASLTPLTSVTDADGRVSVTYTAGPTIGTDTIQAVLANEVSGTLNITVEAGSAAAINSLTVSAGSNTLVADGNSRVAIRATVLDRDGEGIPAITVNFSTTAGRLLEESAVTNASGVATAELISARQVGSATVTATTSGFSESITVNFVPGAPAVVELSSTPRRVKVREAATIQATVTDANINPVAGQTVTFSFITNTSGANLSSLTVVTGPDGRASITYTAGSTPGTDTIRARLTNGVEGTVEITVEGREIEAINVSAGADTIVADGESSVAIRATAVDNNEVGIPGITVSFTTTAGRLSSRTAITDDNGVATVDLISATKMGTATVTAEAEGFQNSVTVTFVAGSPSNLALVASPGTVQIRKTANIQATVTDANDNPVAGQRVNFSFVTNTSGGTLTPVSGDTDSNGQTSVTYTAGLTPGTDTIQAVLTNGIESTVSIVVELPEIGSVTVNAGADTIVADGESSVAIRATVFDEENQRIPGITVSFSTTAGTLSANTAVTNTQGIATVNLISATQVGTATVTATAGGFSDTVSVTFVPGAPALVQLTTTSTVVTAREEATIQATVTDANNNPIADQTVTFSLMTNTSGASLDPLTGQTDENGRVSVTYTAGLTPGTDTIRAVLTNGVESTLDITVESIATSIQLLVSSPQLNSAGLDTVTLSALVKNADNNVVPGVLVKFAATSGSITIVNDITDATGTATARLGTGGDPINREITVTARTDTLQDSNTVNVTGTTLTFSGTTSLVLNGQTTLTIFLRDSGGNGIFGQQINLVSAVGNQLSATTVTTDTSGRAEVTVTATVSGEDVITASIPNSTVSGAFTLTVSPDNFTFTSPTPPVEIPLEATQLVRVHWEEDNVNQVNEPITFFITRGTLINPVTAERGSSITVQTDANGDATVNITSINAGPSIITASADRPGGPSAQLNVEFIATTPRFLLLQADRATVGVNAEGSTDQRSVITAVVRDPQNNLVKNQRVVFSLTDVSGGTISQGSAITDSFGRASTVYIAGNAPSAKDGVIIEARVEGTSPDCDPTVPNPTGPCDQITLTVAEQELFIVLGTGNLIEAPSSTQYAKPYSVLVTDANGNPVAGARVTLSVLPTRYEKGFYVPTFDEDGNFLIWAKFRTIDPANGGDDGDRACTNEDANRNGILDPGEDFNNSGKLEPANVATIDPESRVVTTDESGFAFFNVVYAREFTWVEVELEARTTVSGSEFFSRTTFFLPGLADDFTVETVAPPGQISTFGRATTCTCIDELTNPACPSLLGLNPVRIVDLSSDTIPGSGGEVTFTIQGGSQSTYEVRASTGTLNGVPQPLPITVNFRDTVTLAVGPNPNDTSRTIVVTAIDEVTSQQTTITITQAAPLVIGLSTTTLPGNGGTVEISISGGSQTAYSVEATTGTINGIPQPTPVSVSFGETALLEVEPNPTTEDRNINITARDQLTNEQKTVTIIQEGRQIPIIASVTVSAEPDSIVADGTSKAVIRATVLDSSNVGIAEVTVTFTTTLGTLSATSATTDASGVAVVDLTSGTRIGTATVTATAGDFSDNTTVDFVAGPPAVVSLEATPATVNAGNTAIIEATVQDANFNPVAGVEVTFSLLSNVSGATLNPTEGITDELGQTRVIYTSGDTPGTDIVQGQTNSGVSGTVEIIVEPAPVTPADIQLLVDSPQINSAGTDTVLLTALVKDGNNNFLPGVSVSFSATSGGIQVLNPVTDESGAATARLSTGNDPSNRTITVTARTGALSASNTVRVTGTTITFSGANSLVLGANTTLTLFLRDSAGRGIPNQQIEVTSNRGNTLSVPQPTDFDGRTTVTVTATEAGADVITAMGAGVTSSFNLTVSSANFVFTSPAPDTEVPLVTSQAVIVHWDEAGVNQVNQSITFFVTRGQFSNGESTITVLTDGNGDATVNVSSDNAGPAIITAAADQVGGPSAQLSIEFIATIPRFLIAQASPATIGVNAEGETDQQSVITAVVRDPQNNPVKNQTVIFSLSDVSGGSISPASAVTDSFGRASTVYTAGLSPSAKDGVIIDAEVTGTVGCDPTVPNPTGPCDRVTLTVAQQSLFVTLGTGNLIETPSSTQYAKPYSVLVTDADGNPVAGAEVNLSVLPTRYQKGRYVPVFDEAGEFVAWEKFLTIDPESGVDDDVDQACNNEDLNTNGILDLGEDFNNNAKLDPGNVATIDPGVVITDASGFAFFNVVYAREFTWVEVRLEARTEVSGSEFSSQAIFFLPGLASDFNQENIAPPGVLSPFGQARTCICTEFADSSCPTQSTAAPNDIQLLVSSPQLNSDGSDTVTLTALVKDINNNFLPGVPVRFKADSGGILVLNSVTDFTGTATATLGTAGDPLNRPITVTASTGLLSDENSVTVTGTTVTFSGANSLVLGDTITLTIFLRDSGGTGIPNQDLQLSSALGNTLSANTVTTDFDGKATVNVTAVIAGTDTITASINRLDPPGSASGTFTLTVSPDNFVFTEPLPPPNPLTEVDLGADQTIIVHWDIAGVPQTGETITFSTTRGTLTNPDTAETGSRVTATTDANGDALVTIASDNAGPAIITASADTSGGPSSQLLIEFVAITPDSLILQADPATISINTEGSTAQQSVITATVRDPQGNLVKNQTVIFSLSDVTGGSIFPASAVTDSSGRASTVYTAGLVPSAQDGVIISAEIAGTPPGCDPTNPIASGRPCHQVTLTVAQQSLFITLGTSNLIETPSSTQYAKPYSVLVTDVNGNGVEGVEVTLSVVSTRYQKGTYEQVFDQDNEFVIWAKFPTVVCNNEDLNRNGILDADDFDENANNRLDPGNVATVDPGIVVTDSTGFAFFDVKYAREFTWVEVELKARTTVSGSEFSSQAVFFLPIAASDVSIENVAPPGQISPFGTAAVCADPN